MRERGASEDGPAVCWTLTAAFAAAVFVLHLCCLSRYGIFRDELYYLACARHPALGYVDQPPFSIALLAAVRALFGESLAAIRVVAALAGACTVAIVGLLAAEMGGRRFAQGLAMLCAALCPVFLAVDHFYSLNALDLLLWSVCWLVWLKLCRRPSIGLWIALGVALGLGLLNKYSVLWLIAGLAAGILLTDKRRMLLTPGPWIALSIAAALFSPHLVWEARRGWPSIEFIRNAETMKMATFTPAQFLLGQIVAMQPITAPVWLAGLGGLLASARLARWRSAGIAFVAVAAILAVNGHSRVNYLSPAYAPLLAAGGCLLEWKLAAAWARTAIVAAVAALGALTVPLALPVLPARTFIRYQDRIGLRVPRDEKGRQALLPQYFADEFGWKEMAQTVARVYRSLPDPERKRCAIWAQNYGEAGAIDYFGPQLGLPPAISGHNSYWLWGPGHRPADLLIAVNANEERLRKLFRDVRVAAELNEPLAMPFEASARICVARGPRRPISGIWPTVKMYR
jgi:hypothetical protein